MSIKRKNADRERGCNDSIYDFSSDSVSVLPAAFGSGSDTAEKMDRLPEGADFRNERRRGKQSDPHRIPENGELMCSVFVLSEDGEKKWFKGNYNNNF